MPLAAEATREFIRYPDKAFTVGLAKDDMGPELGAFLEECGMGFGGHALEWNRVYPYWAVAVDNDGDIIGAVNIVHSVPVGRLEQLTYRKDTEKGLRVQLLHELVILGMAALAANGSELLAGTISGSDEPHLDWWKRRGAVTSIRDGHILLMEIPNG